MLTVLDNHVLLRWNGMDAASAASELLGCCGSRAWAAAMVAGRPYAGVDVFVQDADRTWQGLSVEDWNEAFLSHPRIGDKRAPVHATAQSGAWSSEEQGGMAAAGADMEERLRRGNEAYERRFGRTYIVCASGKSAEEMLGILERRLGNAPDEELPLAVEEQRQITQLRLRKWLGI